MKILITGGAGFIGANIAVSLRQKYFDARITAFDNLKRRGSELNLSRLKTNDITFIHGDIRVSSDLNDLEEFDILIECSAEPAVQAGSAGNPNYVIDTNLLGTINCLEACRRNHAKMIFMSTSRVYPIEALCSLPLLEDATRYSISASSSGIGWSSEGINSDFPLKGFRSLYGATKYASELMIDEYRNMYGLKAIVNRLGVISGPWQMGKVDQGVIVLWAARHFYGGQLSYNGFGGYGKQVRDLLHVSDLCAIVELQLCSIDIWDGNLFNIGGGKNNSISLLELTKKCEEKTGKQISFSRDASTNKYDIPYYVTDNTNVSLFSKWTPEKNIDDILSDIFSWLEDNEIALQPLLG